MRWDTPEINALGTMTDPALAKKLGRTAKAVEHKRRQLDVPAFTPHRRTWTKRERARLGGMTDGALAAKLGISRRCVLKTRQRLGIGAFRKQQP